MGLVFSSGNSGGIVASEAYQNKDAPRFAVLFTSLVWWNSCLMGMILGSNQDTQQAWHFVYSISSPHSSFIWLFPARTGVEISYMALNQPMITFRIMRARSISISGVWAIWPGMRLFNWAMIIRPIDTCFNPESLRNVYLVRGLSRYGFGIRGTRLQSWSVGVLELCTDRSLCILWSLFIWFGKLKLLLDPIDRSRHHTSILVHGYQSFRQSWVWVVVQRIKSIIMGRGKIIDMKFDKCRSQGILLIEPYSELIFDFTTHKLLRGRITLTGT